MIINIESSDQLLDYLRATKRIGSQEKPVVQPLKVAYQTRLSGCYGNKALPG